MMKAKDGLKLKTICLILFLNSFGTPGDFNDGCPILSIDIFLVDSILGISVKL